jgi:hypothetical protein
VPGRFSLSPLAHGLGVGIRHRAAVGSERRDVRAQIVLVAVPVLGIGSSLYFRVVLTGTDQLLAAFALLAGTSIAAFTQVAAWREKLTVRAKRVDGVASRALDEAVAHILAVVVASVFASLVMVILSNVPLGDEPTKVTLWVVRAFSAAGIGVGLYVALTLVIVVNLLWDAYGRANPPIAVVDDSSPAKRQSA